MALNPERIERLDRKLRDYVDDGQLPGFHVVLLHEDEVIHSSLYGARCVESGAPVEADTIWRIFSMTKPITAVAALMLWEEGGFDLNDPLGDYLPEFANRKVWAGGTADSPRLETADPIRIWHLMTHCAGLSYSKASDHPVEELYDRAGLDWSVVQTISLSETCARLAGQPLLFQPGTEWNYSISIDVLGRLVEIVSGQPLDVFMADRIFAPLGMTDTGFYIPREKAPRLARMHAIEETGQRLQPLGSAAGSRILEPPSGAYGGAGLASTMADYVRFARLLGKGGGLDGTRLISRSTLAMATQNHLPDGADMHRIQRPLAGRREPPGIGFSLLGSVIVDPAAAKTGMSRGSYGWPGAAGTCFWVDPERDLACVFMTQVSSPVNWVIRNRLQTLVYQALL